MLSKDLPNSIIGKEDLSIKTGMLDPISELIDLQQSGSFEDCVKLACQKFHERFHHSIKNLLHEFPEDKIDMRGKLFWSGTKRAPVLIKLDSENDLHLSFISSCANLYAYTVGIPQSRDKSAIQSIISNIKLKEFVPYNKKINLTNEEEKEAQQKEDEINDILLRNLKERAQECPKDSIRVTKGDVSDDTNSNFEFIFSASNLRAMNYRLGKWDEIYTKMYTAGIIPSVPPVNATIVGAVGMELYKMIQGFENTIDYNNACINLSTPSFLFTQPEQPRETKDSEFDPLMMCPVKAIPVGWTIWDNIEVTGPMTIQEFFDKIKADYNVVVTLLSSGTIVIYNSYLPNNKHEPRLERKIEDIHVEVGKPVEGRTYIELEVSGETVEDNIDAIMPKFKYIFA